MENNTINSTILKELQQQLQQKKEQLESQLSQFAQKDQHLPDDWDTTYPRVPEGNLEEAADEVEEYSNKLHVEFSLEIQLRDVTRALERIEQGMYGVCQTCTKPIPLERLRVSPEASLCGECAKTAHP
jgi:RNA polymerase-binding transcription factor DksA